ncbi:MAG: FAD:protein FMN transferase [Chloroflexi bacterium]|nr:FAD:protein FMN transferase [Chloroflexota bacterium]
MTPVYYTSFRAMGCQVTVQLATSADGDALLRAVPGQFEALESELSRFRPDSGLMRLNRCAGQWCAVTEALFDTVRAARHAALITDGLFNPLVLPALRSLGYDRSFEQIDSPNPVPSGPAARWQDIELRAQSRLVRIPAGSAIDLGGIAKGWAAAKIADELAAYGPVLVNIGGDMVARGAPAGLSGWPVDIGDPFNNGSVGQLALKNTSIATSGVDFRRWRTADGREQHHIIDPRSGRPAQSDVLSVSVVHPHAPTAEAYTKAVMLLGAEPGLEWLNQRWYAAGLVVKHDGTVLATDSITLLFVERTLS